MDRIAQKYNHLLRSQLEQAASRAINRVVTQARTEAIKQVRKVYNIDKKYFQNKVGDKKNRYNALRVWKANPSNLTGKLLAYGKPIPLVAFPYQQTEKGVSVTIKKGDTKSIAHAFVATMKSGHTSIWAKGHYASNQFHFRKKRVRPYPRNDNPIEQLLTTSVQTAVVSESVLTALQINVEENLPARMEREVKQIIREITRL